MWPYKGISSGSLRDMISFEKLGRELINMYMKKAEKSEGARKKEEGQAGHTANGPRDTKVAAFYP